MEKGRHRFSVTADAYGLTYSGISRSLASRPPYRTVVWERSPSNPTGMSVKSHPDAAISLLGNRSGAPTLR